MSSLRALIALVVLTSVACSPAPPSVGSTQSTAPATPTAAPSIAPSATPRPTPMVLSALVGNWLGFHSCQRIVDIFTAAGMPEQALLNAAESGTIPGVSTIEGIDDPDDPCVGATDKRHWHFFNPDGEFGSLDMDRQKVDFGRWALVDADTFTIEGTPFDFEVSRNELRMEPVEIGTCPVNGEWCPEAWKLMVAMPGMAWKRSNE